MNRYRIFLAVVLASAMTVVGTAAPQIGDKAPAIKVAKWVTSQPAALPDESTSGKHVFLVEFWATWLPKSLKNIPHLAGLQKKYEKDGLVVIGISNEEPETIVEFINKKQGMSYYVGSDDEMATSTAWTDDVPEIPYAFLVNQSGTVVWQGDSFTESEAMDKAIEQVLAGKYDVEAAKRAAMAAREFDRLMSELQPAFAIKDRDKVFKLLDQMVALKPLELQPYLIKRQALAEFDMADKIPEWDNRILEAFKDSAATLRQIARFELDKDLVHRSPALLLRSILRANDVAKGRDAETMALLARSQCELGMIDAAIASQTKAVALATDEAKDYYRKVLDYYKAAQKLSEDQRRTHAGDE
ncbi:MAG: TlpA family protein disulfide reductase [Phycisphaerae bacterium]|nr:TlpA family protein disulfide reductase [Phycisphaerae bacterium]